MDVLIAAVNGARPAVLRCRAAEWSLCLTNATSSDGRIVPLLYGLEARNLERVTAIVSD